MKAGSHGPAVRNTRGRWIALAAAVPLGAILGLFFVFAPLFTDGPRSLVDPERLASFALTAGVFLVGATALAWVGRGDWWALGALGLPGLALAAWYAFKEPGVAGLAALYAGLLIAAIAAGRLFALRLRGRGQAEA